MALRSVIVEDELPSLERLKTMLNDFSEIELIGEAQDGQSAVELIERLKPDLVFLDIRLPVFTGFDVLQKITVTPQIIFVTAYDQYAVDAFEKNAVDYLLKPMSPRRLAQAVEKATKTQALVDEHVLSILRSAIQPANVQRFCVKIGDEILFIAVEDVYFFKAEDKYVFLHTFNKEYIYDSTLKELQIGLDEKQFLRIHKSVMIATDKIDKIKRSFAGKYIVQLADHKKSQFEIGRTFLSGVREQLKF